MMNYHEVWRSMNDLEIVTSKVCSAREILDSAMEALGNGNREKAEALMCAADEFLQYYLAEFDEKFKVAWKETVSKLKTENEEHYEAVLKEKEYYDTAYKGSAWDDGMRPWGHSDLEYGLANDLLTQDRDSNFPGENTVCDKDDASEECKDAWNDFWDQNNQYTDEEINSMCEEAERHSSSYYDYDRNDLKKDNPFEDKKVYESPDDGKTAYVRNHGSLERSEVDKVVKWQLPVEEVIDENTQEMDYCITFPDDLLKTANLNEGDTIEWVDQGDGSYLLKKIIITEEN